MLALFSFLIVILFSMIVVKIGTIALEATGLSADISAFQSQSAFSGVGFTTQESEVLMAHPLRRKILRFLMLMGSAGLTSAIATLILTFTNSAGAVHFFNFQVDIVVYNIYMIVVVLLLLYTMSRTTWFDRLVRWVLEKPLHLIKKRIALYDYEKILGLSKGYTIGSFEVPKRHWMVNKTIGHLELEKEGLIVLGVYREIHGHQDYIGIPSMEFQIRKKDKIMIYGKESVISNIARREKGVKGLKDRKEAIALKKKLDIIKQIDEDKLRKLMNSS